MDQVGGAACGHAGALARAALSCFVSVLMIRCLHGYRPNDPNLQREGAAFNQLAVRPWYLTALRLSVPYPGPPPHPSSLERPLSYALAIASTRCVIFSAIHVAQSISIFCLGYHEQVDCMKT